MYLFVHKFINFVGKKKLFTKSFKKKKKTYIRNQKYRSPLIPIGKK